MDPVAGQAHLHLPLLLVCQQLGLHRRSRQSRGRRHAHAASRNGLHKARECRAGGRCQAQAGGRNAKASGGAARTLHTHAAPPAEHQQCACSSTSLYRRRRRCPASPQLPSARRRRPAPPAHQPPPPLPLHPPLPAPPGLAAPRPTQSWGPPWQPGRRPVVQGTCQCLLGDRTRGRRGTSRLTQADHSMQPIRNSCVHPRDQASDRARASVSVPSAIPLRAPYPP